jgi:hypothetical protein
MHTLQFTPQIVIHVAAKLHHPLPGLALFWFSSDGVSVIPIPSILENLPRNYNFERGSEASLTFLEKYIEINFAKVVHNTALRRGPSCLHTACVCSLAVV